MTAVKVEDSSEQYKTNSPRTQITIGDAVYQLVTGTLKLRLIKSEDCGETWASNLSTGGATKFVDAWYDADNNVWHIAWIDQSNDGVWYNSFDFDTDTFGTAVQVYAATGIVLDSNNNWCSITKAEGGNLLVAFQFGGALFQPHENGLYRSTDGGSSWSSRANIAEAHGADYCLLFPDFSGDDGDVIGIYSDASADELSIKQYDDSANTITETSVASNAVAGTYSALFGAAMRDSDGTIFTAVVNARESASGKVQAWKILGTSVTQLDDVVTNAYLEACTAVMYDQTNDAVYVVYARDPDATSTDSVKAYWKRISALGGSWSDETEVSDEETAMDNLFLDPGHANTSKFLPIWFDNGTGGVGDGNDLETDPDSCITPTAIPITLTVTRADMDEDDIVGGGEQIVLTLEASLWDSSVGSNASVTEDLICGLTSNGTEVLGWNNVVKGGECYSAAVLDDSPVGYWRLGDSTGDATDLSGNGNDGTYENFQETGKALIPNSVQLSTKFNNATAKVSVTAASDINGVFDAGGSLEAIIRPWSDGGGHQGRIFAKNDTNGGFEFTVYEQNAGYVRLQFRHDFSTTDGVWVTSVAVPLAKSNHVAVAYNNSDVANVPTVFINGGEYTLDNGGLIEVSAPVGTRVSDASSDLYIGNTAAVSGNLHYSGEIQEAAVYKSVLSKSNILDHLKAASNPFGLTYQNVARTSDTVVTITLPAFILYDISQTETITVTAVAATHAGSSDVTGSPTFDITPTDHVTSYQPPSGDPGGGGPGGSVDDPPDGSTGGGGPGDGTGGGAGGTDDFGGYNGGLGTQSPQANRVLGEGDDYEFGLIGLGIGLDAGSGMPPRVLRIEVAEIGPTSDEEPQV